MGVSEFLAKVEEHDSEFRKNVDENQANKVKVEKSQEDKNDVIEHEVQGLADDREEGEIVDDYEFIISSDEEFCMRQRIEELEATNAELEKIAKISGNSAEYNYVAKKDSQLYGTERFPLASIDLMNAMDCQRAAQIPTDASSISSVEFTTPKKRKRLKSKVSRGSEREHKQQTSKQDQKHRTEAHRSYYKKNKRVSKRNNMILLRSNKDLETYSNSNETSESDGDDNYSSGCYLSREELRFAVGRFTNSEMNSGNLKARLEKDKNRNDNNDISVKYSLFTDKKCDNSIQPIVVDENESSDSVSLEEQELRLIALKSAVMKKHLARKKRDAEVAYSPTDFEDVLANSSYPIRDDEMDVVEVEMDELEHNSRNSMEISPVASPKLHLSPEEENSRMSMATEIDQVNELENTKLVDMDIANSDSEDELRPYKNDKEKWLPLDQIPLPSVREPRSALCQKAIQMAYDVLMHPPSCTPIQYVSFPPEHSLEPPPLPPGVTYFEEQPPPPPPFHVDYPPTKQRVLHSGDKQKNQNLFFRNSQQIDAHNRVKKEIPCTSVESSNEHVEFEKGEEDDEEEEALRALLLSKFNNPKVWKSKNPNINLPSKENSTKQNDDPEDLRCLLLTRIDERKSSKNPTESILKEAVRRLKLKPTFVHSGYKEGIGDNIRSNESRNSQSCSPIETQTNVILSNEGSQSTGSNGNSQVLVLSEGKNGSLPLAFKEIQSKSKPSYLYPIEPSSTDQMLDKKIAFVTVRSVQKINETYNLENKEINTDISTKTNNDKQTIDNLTFANSLNTKGVLISGTDEGLHSKEYTIPHETKLSKSDETPLNVKKNMKTLKVGKEADPNDGNNGSTVPHEPCDIENMINAVDAGEKSAKVTKISVTSELSKEKLCKELIDKTTSLNADQNLLTGLCESPSSSSASQAFLSKRIIKPNKFVNTKSERKRKSQDVVKVPVNILQTASNPDSAQTTSFSYSSSNSSRLLTSADISAVQVKKLIISLRASDTETSDEESLRLVKNSTLRANHPRFQTIEPIVCTINNDYYDNASPISLPMDSPGITPQRANSPSGECLVTEGGLTKSFVNDCFKEKLDTFLKNVRTQVQQAVSQPNKPINEMSNSNPSNSKTFSTPVAMRHLPQASQQEYRRLVHRMQLLEKQKQLKSGERETTVTNTLTKKAHTNEVTKRLSSLKSPLESKQTSPSQETSKASNGNNLFKKVLLKNANYTTTTPKSNNSKSVQKGTAQQQPCKSNVLREYENSFLKTGTGIITTLNKSLQLVEEAKQAKMVKLQYQKRLQELRIEMDEIQHKLRQAQLKISRIYPEICESNEVITTLKQRRSKLLKAATNLGKFIKGNEYRLNNDLKQQIMMKSKILATQIKLVNSMQYSDIVKVKEMLNQDESSEDSNINQNLHLDKEETCGSAKKPNENVLPSNETVSDKSGQENIHFKDSSKLFNNITGNGLNEDFHKAADNDMLNYSNAETPSPNEEEIDTEENASRELPEKNDDISKEVVKFENISEKDDSLMSIDEKKTSLVPEYISPLLPFKTTKRARTESKRLVIGDPLFSPIAQNTSRMKAISDRGTIQTELSNFYVSLSFIDEKFTCRKHKQRQQMSEDNKTKENSTESTPSLGKIRQHLSCFRALKERIAKSPEKK